MKTTLNNLIGERFGKTVVISRGENARDGKVRWNCQCDCGGMHLTSGTNLRSGIATSCGCVARAKSSARARKRFRRTIPEVITPADIDEFL